MAPIAFYDSNPGPFDTVAGTYPAAAEYAVLYADTSLEPGYRPQPNPRIPHVRFNTRRGGADAAKYAGACDYEPGNVAFVGDNLAAWATGRNGLELRARVYASRANVPAALAQVALLPNVWWWIPTLDNNPHWTPALIVESIKAMTGAVILADRIWGIQWGTNQSYDTSYLFAEW
jgi:hypothetical protein